MLVAIISEPSKSAATARSGGAALGEAGSSLGSFMSSLALGRWMRSPSNGDVAHVDAAHSLYVVRRGDTLDRIAEEHATSAPEIRARNGIANPNHIVVGQQLVLR